MEIRFLSPAVIAVGLFALFSFSPAPAGADPSGPEPATIYVKLFDDLPVRVEPETERLVTRGPPVDAETLEFFNTISSARWGPVHTVAEETLREFRQRGQSRTGKPLPDLTVEFLLTVDDRADVERLVERLSRHSLVEHASLLTGRAELLLPPDYEPNQTYLKATPDGVGAQAMWSSPGATGSGVTVAVVEYNFNANHQDLPQISTVLGNPTNPSNSPDADQHGTASIGLVAAKDNGWGTTGIAHGASVIFSAVSGDKIAKAITNTFPYLDFGDVINVSMGVRTDGFSMPVEYWLNVYNAIKTATANGINVIIGAGNGHQLNNVGTNLDSHDPDSGGPSHGPFLRENDSGSIYAGAGAPPNYGTQPARSRVLVSNYGTRLDVQGQGALVWTTGYGDIYNAEGSNLYYTDRYWGTSSASAVVSGAVALLQSAHLSVRGFAASPGNIRQALVQTGVPQDMHFGGNIGPHLALPDAHALLMTVPSTPASLQVTDWYCWGIGDAVWSASTSGTVTHYKLEGAPTYEFDYGVETIYSGSDTSTMFTVGQTTWFRVKGCNDSLCSEPSYVDGPVHYWSVCQ